MRLPSGARGFESLRLRYKKWQKTTENRRFLFENRKNVLIIRWLLPQNTRKGNALCLLKAIYKIVKCKNGGGISLFLLKKIFFSGMIKEISV